MPFKKKPKQVVIIGGGFGGVQAALRLAGFNDENLKITLITKYPHFNYYAALYRHIIGGPAITTNISLREIFKNTAVELVEDVVKKIDVKKKIVCVRSSCNYNYDYLIVALGSETDYKGIENLKEIAQGVKNLAQALQLKKKIHDHLVNCKLNLKPHERCAAHMVIVGAGPTGVELAGSLAEYKQHVAQAHDIPDSYVTIDLVESAEQVVPWLPADMGLEIERRLRDLGVNVYLNKRVEQADLESTYITGTFIKTSTLIWTAGARGNHLLETVKEFVLNDHGQVQVNKYLNPPGYKNIYVVGDCADIKYTGMAQTAVQGGQYAAEMILRNINRQKKLPFEAQTPIYAIPVGNSWAATKVGTRTMYGKSGWWWRRWLDWKLYRSFLPMNDAWVAFRGDILEQDKCSICESE